jgi:HlyD family secretion protein
MNENTRATDQPTAGSSSKTAVKSRGFLHRRRTQTIIKVVAFVLVAGFILVRVKFAPLPVMSREAGPETVVAEVMGTGTLEPRVQATISAELSGLLQQVLVDQDDRVGAGQLLAQLDDATLKQQVEMAKAAVAAARAGVERARADEARAQAVMEQARLEHKRVTDLLQTEVASQSDADKAIEHLKISEAGLKHTEAAIVEAERLVATAERNLDYQRERLFDARIISPFDGLVVKRQRDPGNVVVPGSAILQVVATNQMWVSAWVDETALAHLASAQTARVVFRSEPGRSYPGKVFRLGRQTDRETREFLVDVDVARLPANWAVGQRAEVFIETGRKEVAVAIPSVMVHWRKGQAGVYVDERGKARWRAVKLGIRGTNRVEVIEGVAAGESVVRSPGPKGGELRDGRRITVAKP